MDKEQENDNPQLPTESAEQLYQDSPCGYVSFLNDGTIFNINNSLLNWLGYAREEVIRRMRFQQLFNMGGQIYFETHFFPLIKMQGFVNEINFEIRRKNKSSFPCLMNVKEVTRPEKEQKTYRASIFNISDRKNYEKELIQARKNAEEASKAKAALLSMISHEIRTPLNAILGIGKLLHNTSLNPQQEEYSRLLLLSSENLLGLVNNLLDMSKIEAHKVKLEKLPFSLPEMLEILVSTFQVKCREKGIELRVEILESLPEHLLGDPFKLNQILTNLLGNAIKFTEAGHVKLQIDVLEKTDSRVKLHFAVSDTGMGIPEDKLGIIFKEFSQASYDVGLKYGGTGLGLTISQNLLELHNSSMKVESEEGKGSRFSFDLQYELDPENRKKLEQRQKEWQEQRLNKGYVLVVDDNPMNIFIIKEYLQGWNLEFRAVESGKKAIEAVQKENFDLILMDLHMPELDGYETSMAIRDLPLPQQPVILALSASASGEEVKLDKARMQDFVPKPFTPMELFEKLSHYLKGPDSSTPTETGSSMGPASASIDISGFLKMGQKNPEFLSQALSITRKAFAGYKEEFRAVADSRDPEELDALIHKMTMTIHQVRADLLTRLLQDYHQQLQEHADPARLESLEKQILEKFDHIIREVEAFLDAGT